MNNKYIKLGCSIYFKYYDFENICSDIEVLIWKK
ncbi:hypothetical protein LGKMAHEF_04244 [Aeromonas salmonicida]|nr:Uncharacterised protein [Aeromonas salmonicida]SUU73542.1 Uncharacterised protein [Aeromonas salmonicida]